MQATLNLGLDKTKATGCNQMAFESTSKKLKYNTKKASMLRLFINLGERGLNCFKQQIVIMIMF